MKLVYEVNDKPKFGQLLIFSLQQLLAIICSTILVPIVTNGTTGTEMLSTAAALVGAGFGTLFYVFVTKKKSPIFLGSSFAFLTPLAIAATIGSYWGIILGAVCAGLVYVVFSLVITKFGTGWVDKLLPPVIIGPTVAVIGLQLCGNAAGHFVATGYSNYSLVGFICAAITLFTIVFCSVKGGKKLSLVPFVVGAAVGFVVAIIITLVGYNGFGSEVCRIVNFDPLVKNFAEIKFTSFFSLPKFTFLGKGNALTGSSIARIIVAYTPIAFVVFAEHIADHKNMSSILGTDLTKDPGLSRTLIGDGIGSIIGTFFGGCPNTTYGESIACVAITGNASVVSIIGAALMAIVLAFFTPFIELINCLPNCILGAMEMALYGFIGVSGLKMLKNIDLGDNRNLFVVSVILVAGIGGLELVFGDIAALGTPDFAGVEVTNVATALILGIIVNLICKKWKKGEDDNEENKEENK